MRPLAGPDDKMLARLSGHVAIPEFVMLARPGFIDIAEPPRPSDFGLTVRLSRWRSGVHCAAAPPHATFSQA
jgi:hypothetical protein